MRLKLYIFLIAFLAIFSEQKGFGQRIKGAVIFGGNLTQVDGDNAYGFNKWGLNVGAAAIVPIKKNFSFTLETIYNQKGSNQKAWYYEEVTDTSGNVIDVRTGQYKVKLDYLEVPFLIQYTDKKNNHRWNWIFIWSACECKRIPTRHPCSNNHVKQWHIRQK